MESRPAPTRAGRPAHAAPPRRPSDVAARRLETVVRETAWHEAQAERLDRGARASQGGRRGVRGRITATTRGRSHGRRRAGDDAADGSALAAWEMRAAELRARRDRLAGESARPRERPSRRREPSRAGRGVDAIAEERMARADRDVAALGDRERTSTEAARRAAGRGRHERRRRGGRARGTRRGPCRGCGGPGSARCRRTRGDRRARTSARRRRPAAGRGPRRARGASRPRGPPRGDRRRAGRSRRPRHRPAERAAGFEPIGARRSPPRLPMSRMPDDDPSCPTRPSRSRRPSPLVTPLWTAAAPDGPPPSPARLGQLRRRFHELGAVNPYARRRIRRAQGPARDARDAGVATCARRSSGPASSSPSSTRSSPTASGRRSRRSRPPSRPASSSSSVAASRGCR